MVKQLMLQVLCVCVRAVQRGDRVPTQARCEVGGRGTSVHLQPNTTGLQDLL